MFQIYFSEGSIFDGQLQVAVRYITTNCQKRLLKFIPLGHKWLLLWSVKYFFGEGLKQYFLKSQGLRLIECSLGVFFQDLPL